MTSVSVFRCLGWVSGYPAELGAVRGVILLGRLLRRVLLGHSGLLPTVFPISLLFIYLFIFLRIILFNFLYLF